MMNHDWFVCYQSVHVNVVFFAYLAHKNIYAILCSSQSFRSAGIIPVYVGRMDGNSTPLIYQNKFFWKGYLPMNRIHLSVKVFAFKYWIFVCLSRQLSLTRQHRVGRYRWRSEKKNYIKPKLCQYRMILHIAKVYDTIERTRKTACYHGVLYLNVDFSQFIHLSVSITMHKKWICFCTLSVREWIIEKAEYKL